MNYDQLKQIVLLTQDAKDLGWEFFMDEGQLKARDNTYAQDTTAFHNQDHFYEWLEEQFDKKD
ncbi:hypothetical protein [Alkalihalobacterium sp. APHAB7]|uniref:hypothetical protein n=1 Tax=Alkalihalobacterium sp. APHAB7 TaxID=3402081 RepID=UPI003AAE8903